MVIRGGGRHFGLRFRRQIPCYSKCCLNSIRSAFVIFLKSHLLRVHLLCFRSRKIKKKKIQNQSRERHWHHHSILLFCDGLDSFLTQFNFCCVVAPEKGHVHSLLLVHLAIGLQIEVHLQERMNTF